MSYNFLRGIEVYEARQTLKREIYRLLDLPMPDTLHTLSGPGRRHLPRIQDIPDISA